MRTKSSLWMLSLLIVTLGVACRKEAASQAPAAPAAAAAPASAASAATPTSTAASEFGIPECDDYINKYLTCIERHVPEAAREQVRASLDQTRAMWRQAAATADGRTGLVIGCKAASDAAKTAMTAYGCSF